MFINTPNITDLGYGEHSVIIEAFCKVSALFEQ